MMEGSTFDHECSEAKLSMNSELHILTYQNAKPFCTTCLGSENPGVRCASCSTYGTKTRTASSPGTRLFDAAAYTASFGEKIVPETEDADAEIPAANGDAESNEIGSHQMICNKLETLFEYFGLF